MGKIKAIQTIYKGYKFRSRIEARWAVFFDLTRTKWEYEQEGFILSDGTHYLPDFYLPELDYYVEIKGDKPNKAEKKKCYLLANETDRPVFLLSGGLHTPSIMCFIGDYTYKKFDKINTEFRENEDLFYLMVSYFKDGFFIKEEYNGYDSLVYYLKDNKYNVEKEIKDLEAGKEPSQKDVRRIIELDNELYLSIIGEPHKRVLYGEYEEIEPLSYIRGEVNRIKANKEEKNYFLMWLLDMIDEAKSARFEHGETINV